MAVSSHARSQKCETASPGVYRVLQGIHTVRICEAWNNSAGDRATAEACLYRCWEYKECSMYIPCIHAVETSPEAHPWNWHFGCPSPNVKNPQPVLGVVLLLLLVSFLQQLRVKRRPDWLLFPASFQRSLLPSRPIVPSRWALSTMYVVMGARWTLLATPTCIVSSPTKTEEATTRSQGSW